MSLAAARKVAGVTQRELAVRTSLHWATVSKLERGRMEMTLDYMIRFADALQVAPVAIFAAAAAQVGRSNVLLPLATGAAQ